jgi:polysaccharide biosynthesis protein PslH
MAHRDVDGRQMKILVITMQFPQFPAPGGQTRQFCLLRETAREHDITLLTLAHPPNDGALQELKSFVKEVIVVERKYPYLTPPAPSDLSSSDLFKELFAGDPFEIRKWRAKREIPEYLPQIDEADFDLIQVEHSELAHWVEGLFPNTPKILVLHNVNYLIYKRFFDIALWGKEKVWALAQWLNMRKYEASLAGKFTRYISMSEEDKQLFLRIAPFADVDVIPNGVDTGYFSPRKDPAPEENAIVYTGYMGWKPSVDAVLHFHANVFTDLLHSYPDLKFYVVGKDPAPEVQELASQKNVVVTGFVEDVRPYLEKAKIVVVPLRVGGGTRLKILEAMSMGKAIISTSIGAEGLRVAPGEDIFFADKPEDFLRQSLLLLGNEKLRREIGVRARTDVLSSYDWKIIGARLNNVYSKFRRRH